MYIGLHVKYRYSCQIAMKLEFSRQIFEKYSNIELHENPSSDSQAAACGRTDKHDEVKSLLFYFYLYIFFGGGGRTRPKTEGTPAGPTRQIRTTAPEFRFCDGEINEFLHGLR